MAKKKAIKLAAASAVAASAFVAAAPAQTDAASNVAVEVSKAVTQMKKAYHTYSDVTAQGKFAPIADVYKEYNAAKKAYANAKAVVTKAGGSAKEAYLAQLDATYNEYIAKRVVTYIDAFNYATALEDKKEALEAALEEKEWEKAEELYHEISYELNTRTVILHRVYGQTARNLLVDAFKVEAQDTRDSITNEVSVKMYYDKAKDLVAEGKLEDAKKAMDHVADYVAKLDKDTDFGAYLLTQVSEVKAAYEAKLAPAVESVSAINAKQLVVKFNKAIKADAVIGTVGTDDTLEDGVLTVTSLDNKAVNINAAGAVLSADGKTLTLTAQTSEVFSGRYDVKVAEGAIKSTDDKGIAKYSATIIAEDKVAPTVVGTEQVNASQVKVKFSEPLLTEGAVTFKYSDGSSVAAGAITGSLTPGKDYIVYTLTGVTAGKTVVANFVGAQDYAGNLISPNPSTVSLYKGDKDGVKPVVSSINVLNGSKFEVKFSEELQAAPTIKVGLENATVKQDATDKTKYIATLAAPVKDLQNVEVSAFKDLSGEEGVTFTKVINFAVDTTAPKLSSARLVTDSKDAKQYLELTFDENVTLGSLTKLTVTGTYVKDYITKSLTATDVLKAGIVPVAGTDNVFRIAAASLFTGEDFEGASYSLKLTGDNEIVVDGSGNKGATVVEASFTRGKDGSVTTTDKPVVKSIAKGSNNNEVVVTFDKEIDGATAVNIANYTVNGAAVEKAVLSAYDSVNKVQVVTLTLKADSNGFSGNRYVSVNGVKAKNGALMEAHSEVVDLNENVRPTISSAKLTSTDKITLTFSEAVSNVDDIDGADFDLYVGTTKSAKTVAVEAVAVNATKTELVVTVSAGLTAEELTKGLSLKAVDTLNITDVVGNKANVTTVNVQ